VFVRNTVNPICYVVLFFLLYENFLLVHFFFLSFVAKHPQTHTDTIQKAEMAEKSTQRPKLTLFFDVDTYKGKAASREEEPAPFEKPENTLTIRVHNNLVDFTSPVYPYAEWIRNIDTFSDKNVRGHFYSHAFGGPIGKHFVLGGNANIASMLIFGLRTDNIGYMANHPDFSLVSFKKLCRIMGRPENDPHNFSAFKESGMFAMQTHQTDQRAESKVFMFTTNHRLTPEGLTSIRKALNDPNAIVIEAYPTIPGQLLIDDSNVSEFWTAVRACTDFMHSAVAQKSYVTFAGPSIFAVIIGQCLQRFNIFGHVGVLDYVNKNYVVAMEHGWSKEGVNEPQPAGTFHIPDAPSVVAASAPPAGFVASTNPSVFSNNNNNTNFNITNNNNNNNYGGNGGNSGSGGGGRQYYDSDNWKAPAYNRGNHGDSDYE